MEYKRIIFVAQTGTSREAMAAGILADCTLPYPVEVLSRGLVVQFPEPMNQKSEAVLISNGIEVEGFASVQLKTPFRWRFMCSRSLWGMSWKS